MPVMWRGSPFDQRTVDMLKEAERIGGIRIDPTQGSYQGGAVAASAGTHDGGGAVDCSVRGLTRDQIDRLVAALRQVGFAAWHRRKSQGFSIDHIHAIAVGCPDLSRGAAAQVSQYLRGTNGLADHGPDDGPRTWVGVTWEQYQQQQQPLPDTERPDMILISRKSDGAVFLLGLSGPARLTNGDDIPELQKALADPKYIASVDDGTFDRLAAHSPLTAIS